MLLLYNAGWSFLFEVKIFLCVKVTYFFLLVKLHIFRLNDVDTKCKKFLKQKCSKYMEKVFVLREIFIFSLNLYNKRSILLWNLMLQLCICTLWRHNLKLINQEKSKYLLKQKNFNLFKRQLVVFLKDCWNTIEKLSTRICLIPF